MKPNAIVTKFLNGDMDAGGTIAALEKRVHDLESLLRELDENPNVELGEIGHAKIEEILKVPE